MQDLEPLHVAVLEDRGFKVLDLRLNVSPEQIIAAVNEKNANVVAMSAPLTTTIDVFKQVGVRDQVKVLIGGAPITQRYVEEIGADRCVGSVAGAEATAWEALAGKHYCSK